MSTSPFPLDLFTLRDVLHRAIGHYQGSAVDPDKLNEAMAAGLRFPDYNTLDAALHTRAAPKPPTLTLLPNGQFCIGETTVDIAWLVLQRWSTYEPTTPATQIKSLLSMYQHAPDTQRDRIQAAVQALSRLQDTCIFVSAQFDDYIAASTEPARFHAVCQVILQHHQRRRRE